MRPREGRRGLEEEECTQEPLGGRDGRQKSGGGGVEKDCGFNARERIGRSQGKCFNEKCVNTTHTHTHRSVGPRSVGP